MSPEQSRVQLVQIVQLWAALPDVLICDKYGPRDIKEGSHGRDVSCRAHSDEMSMLAKRNWVVD